MRTKSLGIITYNTNHLKTEQIVLGLVGRCRMKFYALPYIQRPTREVLFQHRPNQSAAAHPKELAAMCGADFIPVEDDAEIDNSCDLYLITGAGILSAECLRGKRVINCHPGVIPAARGLDAFKWSIYNRLPLGVTLHYIDEAVDAGEIITIRQTPVFASDSLESLARRHYENEISLMCDFEACLLQPSNPFKNLFQGNSMRRMKREQESELAEKLEQYKEQFCLKTASLDLSAVQTHIVESCPPPADNSSRIAYKRHHISLSARAFIREAA